MKKLLEEFKAFAIKGNVIDMAVGTMIGGAFSKIVSSLVVDVFTPAISLLLGNMTFSELSYTVIKGENEIVIRYGNFIQNIIDFLIMAICIFAFVKMIIKLKENAKKKEEVVVEADPVIQEPQLSIEAQLLTEIKELLQNQK